MPYFCFRTVTGVVCFVVVVVVVVTVQTLRVFALWTAAVLKV